MPLSSLPLALEARAAATRYQHEQQLSAPPAPPPDDERQQLRRIRGKILVASRVGLMTAHFDFEFLPSVHAQLEAAGYMVDDSGDFTRIFWG